MARYYGYLIGMSMLIHTILFIPRVHMDERYGGAVMSFVVGSVIGSILMFVFASAMMKFKGEGLPEIAARFLPKAIRVPLMMIFGIAYMTAGSLVWIHCAYIVSKYLNPDMALSVLLILFVTVTCLGAVQSSKTVLFGTEIIFVFAVPLLVLVLIHGLFDSNMNYDAVQAMLDYIWVAPSWNSISASSYTFAGYMGLAIFNREFKDMKSIKFLWLFPLTGFGLVLASFFIPVGYLGTDGINDYIYTWVSTVDAIRIKYVFIERVISIYLLILLMMTFVFTMITWHVGSQAISSCFLPYNPRTANWRSKVPSIAACLVLAVATVIAGTQFDEMLLFKVSSYWMRIHTPFDMLFVLLLVIWSKRKRGIQA